MMTVTMDADARKELIQLICAFAIMGRKHTLKEFQRIIGHINWALNGFPLLKPGLSAIYAKTAGNERDLATIRVNAAVVFELDWVARRVEFSTGVHFLKSVEWDPRHANSGTISIFTDVSDLGMAFYIPSLKLAFQCPLPLTTVSEYIFFFEVLAVCSVFHHVANSCNAPPHCLVIYSDSSNTVDIFNTLHAIAPYNRLIISAMNVVLDHHIDYRVLHMQGVDNPIADAVSCYKNDLAASLCPRLVIHTFEPPQDVLGVGSK
jgi:hypothetical protein